MAVFTAGVASGTRLLMPVGVWLSVSVATHVVVSVFMSALGLFVVR